MNGVRETKMEVVDSRPCHVINSLGVQYLEMYMIQAVVDEWYLLKLRKHQLKLCNSRSTNSIHLHPSDEICLKIVWARCVGPKLNSV